MDTARRHEPDLPAPATPRRPPAARPLAENSEINREQAQYGLSMIKQSIVNLLCRKRRGMTNAEICRELGLTADQNGKARNMLSWSILGLLVKEGRLLKRDQHYFLA